MSQPFLSMISEEEGKIVDKGRKLKANLVKICQKKINKKVNVFILNATEQI